MMPPHSEQWPLTSTQKLITHDFFYRLRQSARCMDIIIRDGLGAGGGSYWLLTGMSALGVTMAPHLLLVVPATMMGIALTRLLAKHCASWWRTLVSKHNSCRIINRGLKAICAVIDFSLQVLGAGGATMFALTLAGVAIHTALAVALPIASIALVPFLYKLYTKKNMNQHAGGLGFILHVAGVGGALMWATKTIMMLTAGATVAIPPIAIGIIIGCTALAFGLYLSRIFYSRRYSLENKRIAKLQKKETTEKGLFDLKDIKSIPIHASDIQSTTSKKTSTELKIQDDINHLITTYTAKPRNRQRQQLINMLNAINTADECNRKDKITALLVTAHLAKKHHKENSKALSICESVLARKCQRLFKKHNTTNLNEKSIQDLKEKYANIKTAHAA